MDENSQENTGNVPYLTTSETAYLVSFGLRPTDLKQRKFNATELLLLAKQMNLNIKVEWNKQEQLWIVFLQGEPIMDVDPLFSIAFQAECVDAGDGLARCIVAAFVTTKAIESSRHSGMAMMRDPASG